MYDNTLPTFGFQPGVRCAEARRFEERHPGIRFIDEPGGGDGGANGGTGGTGEPAGGNDDDQLGEGGKKALESERSARKTAETENSELKTKLKEFEDGKLTADQKLQRDADDSKTKVGQLESDNGKLTLENGRLRAALAEGLPVDWADRVRGDTDEEMLADAKKIKASLRDQGSEYTPGVGERGSSVKTEPTPGIGTLRAAYANTPTK